MGRGTILSRKNNARGRSSREGGWSLIELTITLFLLMAIALFGMKTMVAGLNLQNWSIAQSMTDAYAGIETAYAQRYVFSDLAVGTSGTGARWSLNPTSVSVTIGQTPSQPVTAKVYRTYQASTDLVTGAVSYLLESYVVYTNGQLTYCKVSKVYRTGNQ
jgi:hypothetical protein